MVKLLLFANLGLSGFILYHLFFLRRELKPNMNQQRIDDLTAQLSAGNTAAETAVKAEVEEVQKAIDNPNIDTSKLEAEIARNEALKDLVSGIYTPPVELPEEAPAETATPPNPSESPGNPAPSVPVSTEETASTGTETPAAEETTSEETAPFESQAQPNKFPAEDSETSE